MKELLDQASKAYYEGNPIMSDAAFDKLADLFNYSEVGYRATGTTRHAARMYSLQKCFDIAEAPLDLMECIVTPKLDGAAISILYVKGKLTLALTRGDGIAGQDITSKIKLLVPETIDYLEEIVQINGEVVAPKSIPNARNYAAGALNLKYLEEFEDRELEFFAYDLEFIEFTQYSDKLYYLETQGIKTVLDVNPEDWPTDGLVYRLDSETEFKSSGYTSKHPRGAFALKGRKEGVITTLKDVVWQIGKSGAVSPVAILDPVDVDGATVSRATLHNMAYITALNLEIGCKVELIRSGEIIPRIVKRVDQEKNDT